MSTPPPQRDRNMQRNGGRFIAIGVVLMIIGLAITLPLSGTAAGIGWAVFAIGCLPAAAGLALAGSGLVSRRSRAGKPFA
jgi:hypothetical protein